MAGMSPPPSPWQDSDGDDLLELLRDLGIDISEIDADVVSAETLLGANVANSAENQILVAQGDGTLSVETQAQGPNPYDQAQSFTESDLVVSTTDTDVVDGSIELDTITEKTGNVVSRDADNGSFTTSDRSGIVINPNTDLAGVAISISSNTSGATTAYLQESNQTNLDTATLSDGGATLNATLSPGTDYYVVVDDSGADYTSGYNDSPSYPYTGTDLDIVSSFLAGSTDDTIVRAILDVESIKEVEATSGNALIEWNRGIPTDIFEWDVATFTRTLDNETVDVFVAYSDDGGSTWTRTNNGNPIIRNYSLNEDANITSDVDVRIETELSRSDTANNPTLDSAYRSWLV